MPQMGESIAEGTIVRWIKKVGDKVDRDEPLFEISTDKVDAEIPSPAAGVVSEIRVKEGETVPVNSVVAVIGAGGEAKAAAPAPEPKAPTPMPAAKPIEAPKPTPQADGSPTTKAEAPSEPPATRKPEPSPRPEAERGGAAPAEGVRHSAGSGRPEREAEGRGAGAPGVIEDLIRQRSSPLVRKIAKEHNVDITQLHGTGIAGRVTKDGLTRGA